MVIGLLSHKPDRVPSPKSPSCRFSAVGVGPRCDGVSTTANISRPTDTLLHAHSVVLVWTSWSELALQEMGPRAQPASLLPGCQPACQAVCWV